MHSRSLVVIFQALVNNFVMLVFIIIIKGHCYNTQSHFLVTKSHYLDVYVIQTCAIDLWSSYELQYKIIGGSVDFKATMTIIFYAEIKPFSVY